MLPQQFLLKKICFRRKQNIPWGANKPAALSAIWYWVLGVRSHRHVRTLGLMWWGECQHIEAGLPEPQLWKNSTKAYPTPLCGEWAGNCSWLGSSAMWIHRMNVRPHHAAKLLSSFTTHLCFRALAALKKMPTTLSLLALWTLPRYISTNCPPNLAVCTLPLAFVPMGFTAPLGFTRRCRESKRVVCFVIYFIYYGYHSPLTIDPFEQNAFTL